MKQTSFFLGFILIFFITSCQQKEAWIPIYTGEPELAFKHYLGIPDSSTHGLNIEKDSLGNYIHGLGYEDPLHVFSIAKQDNEHLIKITGEVIGGLILRDTLANYHLKLKFKWGNKKYDWMQGRPKDGGILYHQLPKIRHEFQIHEGDVGSYWAKNVILDIPAQWSDQLPESILTARPFLTSHVTTLTDTMLIFNEEAPLHHFEGKDEWQIVIASPYNEKPAGEWNTLELICWENHAVHIVNGKVNTIVLNSMYQDKDGVLRPLNGGRLTLQSEGAVTFFKDIYYKNITECPTQLTKYLKLPHKL